MNRFTNAIRSGLAGMLGQHLSERTKRILFLASFSAQLKDPSEFDDEMRHKLNQMLELSSDDNALKLPVHLSHAIWRNRPFELGVRLSLKNESVQERAHLLGKKVMEAMPKWLRYGDDKRMLGDLEQLLRNWSHVGA